ncbi:MAG: class I SAM-dependent methyltransferase [Roseibium album]|uniref:class I SAM-dependent methyltransferase n=1 Tax=Roseibium album TaxID=311410 RepID=UPI0032EF13B1
MSNTRPILALKRVLKPLAFRALSPAFRGLASLALRDEQTLARMLHELGNHNAMGSTLIADVVPAGLSRIESFADLTWLYSSNPLNHGVSRLTFDEAACLYKLARGLNGDGLAVELGRYKGGTTFLLAAAGCVVVSIDNNRIPGSEARTASLLLVLGRFALDARVRLEHGEATELAQNCEPADLVFLDIGVDSFDITAAVFRSWWPKVRPGGVLLFRDGKNTVLKNTERFVSSLSGDEPQGKLSFDLPGAFVAFHKNADYAR